MRDSLKPIKIWQNRRIRQIILLVSGTFILLWIVLSILFYNYSINKYEQATLMRLAGIANSISLQIDGDHHQYLLQKYQSIDAIQSLGQDSTYDKIHRVLKANHDSNMLKSALYTLALNKTPMYYEFGITSEKKPYFKHRYNSYHESLNIHFETGGTISPYKDEFGMWLSAFAPIKNSKRETVAVVMVDEKLDLFLSNTRSQLWNTFFITLALFICMMVLLLWVLKNIFVMEVRDKLAIEEADLENKRINEQLKIANEKLSNLDLFRKEMITNISHDLRTPLANMIGFLDVLKDDKKIHSQSEKDQYIKIAFNESIKLNQLVTDLFELSKLENNRIILQKEPFNLYELVSDIIQKYQFRIKAKHIDLNFEIEENLGLALGDIKYIDRVFQNLLDNAIRYVDDGGLVKISIINAEKYFKIKICNTGEMIPANELSLIFDRYYIAKKNNKSGTGIGLAISKRICELHNCTIHADSNDSITSFWFTVEKSQLN